MAPSTFTPRITDPAQIKKEQDAVVANMTLRDDDYYEQKIDARLPRTPTVADLEEALGVTLPLEMKARIGKRLHLKKKDLAETELAIQMEEKVNAWIVGGRKGSDLSLDPEGNIVFNPKEAQLGP